MPMRLLVYGDIGGSGGYIGYCKGLFCSGSTPADVQIFFVCSANFLQHLGGLDPEIKVITHPWIDSRRREKRYMWHLWVYPRLIKRLQPDAEFYPSGQLRVYGRKAITVATCHNLLLFDLNELGKYKGQRDYGKLIKYRNNIARSLKRASGTIYLNNYSRDVVHKEIQDVSQSKIIPHGLESAFYRQDKCSYGMSDPITVLYVSPIHFYKHHSEVVRAIAAVKRRTNLKLRLKLIGGGEALALQALEECIRQEGAEEYVDLIGFLPRERLVEHYWNADVFVFASSCETFGITLLEAMGAGLPIACSERTGLPDILKDAGVYFAPEHPESIAKALMQLLIDEEKRKILGEKAQQYASDYTWQRCANSTFDFIRQVTTGRRRALLASKE